MAVRLFGTSEKLFERFHTAIIEHQPTRTRRGIVNGIDKRHAKLIITKDNVAAEKHDAQMIYTLEQNVSY